MLKTGTHIEQIGAKNVFHLKGARSSYVLGAAPDGDLRHLYWGGALGERDAGTMVGLWEKDAGDAVLEKHPREWPSFGNNDLRSPAVLLEHPDGSRLSQFVFQGHEIFPGKPEWEEMPGTYVEDPGEASTLKVLLADPVTGQQAELFYTIYPDWDVVVRRAVLKAGPGKCVIRKLMASSVDFPAGDYHSLSLPGDWTRERLIQERQLGQGLVRLESRRGVSSHQMSPFLAITRDRPNEDSGEAYGFALVYSGNWLMEAEVQSNGRLRVNAGLNDFDFAWNLSEGGALVGPECVLAYSARGLGELSRNFHRLVRRRVVRGPWRDKPRPVLINSWEPFYFSFTQEDIVKLAVSARELGAELVVLDDGWFGRRDDDHTSLGDWQEHKGKLPQGLPSLAKQIHALGMKFGLWFEPEAISPESELYKAHPDWALRVSTRPASMWRNQMVLDLSRADVRGYLFERMSHFIRDAGVDYLKWDMNRPMWEVGNQVLPPGQQAELAHRCVLGLYDLQKRVRDAFPALLMEGCCGGGGRFDLAQLCFQPQFWTSDNTDGRDRVFIQYGSSLFLPPACQGAHVSIVPNHLTGRGTPLRFRAHVALSGCFGLEMDPAKVPSQEREELAEYIRLHKETGRLVMEGDFYRLEDPFKGPRAAWSFVLPDKSQALVFVFQITAPFTGMDSLPVRLKGLDPERLYQVEELGQEWSGAWLAQNGLATNLGLGDYASAMFRLTRRP